MKRLAILVSYSGEGGVERVVNLLAGEFASEVAVDLLTIKFRGPHVRHVPDQVRLIHLRSQHAMTAVAEIAEYLDEYRPDALLVAKDRAGRAAIRAARHASHRVPVWLQLHTNVSQSLEGRDALTRWLRLRAMRRLYPLATGIVAVSHGVRDDLVALCRLPAEKVHVIHNPVIPRDLDQRADEPAPHPWLADKTLPVVMGMGRLTRQKDFATLLRAFAKLRERTPARLVVLGEGADRAALQAQAEALGIADRLLMPGFQSNPYAWLSRADLFVLSSAWEGFGCALAEALALGIPCVSTDCPSGPSEILDRGRYGPLVAVGDCTALAQAMRETLARALPADVLRASVAGFHCSIAARQYLRLLGLVDAPPVVPQAHSAAAASAMRPRLAGWPAPMRA
ncbi:glycosyltransferase [Solimonas soli]|uniref:glycosyltransferase n=1 Tax=Solimonas soli TaxID=413479 RepID=UPI0004AEE70B|nr:glycosyltransferase [Solimonas soli]